MTSTGQSSTSGPAHLLRLSTFLVGTWDVAAPPARRFPLTGSTRVGRQAADRPGPAGYTLYTRRRRSSVRRDHHSRTAGASGMSLPLCSAVRDDVESIFFRVSSLDGRVRAARATAAGQGGPGGAERLPARGVQSSRRGGRRPGWPTSGATSRGPTRGGSRRTPSTDEQTWEKNWEMRFHRKAGEGGDACRGAAGPPCRMVTPVLRLLSPAPWRVPAHCQLALDGYQPGCYRLGRVRVPSSRLRTRHSTGW
jgi:hypothetical protein